MSYIGRGTDKISNIEKLDTITFDGSSSYTLQKNSVNFTPNSANSLQISIDGVVQAGNFTVSGSTIDFGVAIPSTSTNDFIFHYGTGLITTPADGTVGLAQLSATGTKDATTFLRGDNTFASPSGGLLQTVFATANTSSSITTTSYADTNITASITPSSTSSKVLVMVHCQIEAGTGIALHGDIERDIGGSTTLLSGDADGFFRQQDAGQQNNTAIITVDSPSTTSAITYTVQGKNSASGTSSFQGSGAVATIVLQEISG